MKKLKFIKTQIVFALHHAEKGVNDAEVCRKWIGPVQEKTNGLTPRGFHS